MMLTSYTHDYTPINSNEPLKTLRVDKGAAVEITFNYKLARGKLRYNSTVHHKEIIRRKRHTCLLHLLKKYVT